jgi:hypothetical protein
VAQVKDELHIDHRYFVTLDAQDEEIAQLKTELSINKNILENQYHVIEEMIKDSVETDNIISQIKTNIKKLVELNLSEGQNYVQEIEKIIDDLNVDKLK